MYLGRIRCESIRKLGRTPISCLSEGYELIFCYLWALENRFALYSCYCVWMTVKPLAAVARVTKKP